MGYLGLNIFKQLYETLLRCGFVKNYVTCKEYGPYTEVVEQRIRTFLLSTHGFTVTCPLTLAKHQTIKKMITIMTFIYEVYCTVLHNL